MQTQVSFAYPDSDRLVGVAGLTQIPETGLPELPADLHEAADAAASLYAALDSYRVLRARQILPRHARDYALGLAGHAGRFREALRPLVPELVAAAEGRPFWLGRRRCRTACGALLLAAKTLHDAAHGQPGQPGVRQEGGDPCRWDVEAVAQRTRAVRLPDDLRPVFRAVADELCRVVELRTGQPRTVALGLCA